MGFQAAWLCLHEAPLAANTFKPGIFEHLSSNTNTHLGNERQIPDLPFHQPRAPNPPQPPAEELSEFYLITHRESYITGTISVGNERAPSALPPAGTPRPPSHADTSSHNSHTAAREGEARWASGC